MIEKPKKIRMAVVFMGSSDQLRVNWEQFNYLKRKLNSFTLTSYKIKLGNYRRLIDDYHQGKIDVVLKNSYGRHHDNSLEIALERNHIRFLGSGSKATWLGTDKLLTKKVLKQSQVPVVPGMVLDLKNYRNRRQVIMNKIMLPCIVKNPVGTDSRGIFLCRTEHEMRTLISRLGQAAIKKLIIEKYLAGATEVTCFVAGEVPQAYEPAEIVTTKSMLEKEVKDKQAFSIRLPARISAQLSKKIKQLSLKAHKALGCKGFSRADILIKDGSLFFLEVDVHPGFRQQSPTVHSIINSGLSLDEFFLNLYRGL